MDNNDAFFYAGLAGGRQNQINRLEGNLINSQRTEAELRYLLDEFTEATRALQKNDWEARRTEARLLTNEALVRVLGNQLERAGVDVDALLASPETWAQVNDYYADEQPKRERQAGHAFAILPGNINLETNEYDGALVRSSIDGLLAEQKARRVQKEKEAEKHRKVVKRKWLILLGIQLLVIGTPLAYAAYSLYKMFHH